MTATVHKFRAGPLPSVDTRASCRESYAHLKMVEAADEQARIASWVRHTSTPPEREYAAYDRDPKARAHFWWAIAAIYAAVFVGGYLYINR